MVAEGKKGSDPRFVLEVEAKWFADRLTKCEKSWGCGYISTLSDRTRGSTAMKTGKT